jgi:predicted nucleic-acid-binding Zn-ribbon protein
MKLSGRCPKCACEKLYVIDKVHQPDHDSINGIVPLSVATLPVAELDVGMAGKNRHRAAIGTFEAWVCSACGLTEWYAKDFAAPFERAAKLGQIRIAVRPTDAPYR